MDNGLIKAITLNILLPGFVVEGGNGELASFGSLLQGDFFLLPAYAHGSEIIGQFPFGTAETYATGLGSGDSLGLSLADVITLILCHEAKNLQDDIA